MLCWINWGKHLEDPYQISFFVSLNTSGEQWIPAMRPRAALGFILFVLFSHLWAFRPLLFIHLRWRLIDFFLPFSNLSFLSIPLVSLTTASVRLGPSSLYDTALFTFCLIIASTLIRLKKKKETKDNWRASTNLIHQTGSRNKKYINISNVTYHSDTSLTTTTPSISQSWALYIRQFCQDVGKQYFNEVSHLRAW